MTRRELHRRAASSNSSVALDAMTRLGILQPVQPTTSSGWTRYGTGREFLPAATNLCTDPQGVLADGTYWPADTAHTDTTANTAVPLPVPGVPELTKCLMVVNDGTADAPVTANITVVASTSYNQSIYVYCPQFGGNLTITSETGHTFSIAALTGANTGWVRYNAAANTVAGEVVHGLKFSFAGGTASTVYVTGAQLVAATVATPFFCGLTGGCSWTGTANASTSTRAASVLTYPRTFGGAKVFSDTGGTLAMRATPLWTGISGIYPRWLNVAATNAAYGAMIGHGYSSDKWFAASYDGTNLDASEPNVGAVAGTPVGVVGRFVSGTSVDCRANSTSGSQQTTTVASPTYTDAINIGDDKESDGVNSARGSIGPAVVCPSRITDAETATLSTMLQTGAIGADLVRFFRDRSYVNTLVIPLEGDSTAYRIAG